MYVPPDIANMTEDAERNVRGCEPDRAEERLDAVLSRSIEEETELFAALANETRYRILLFIWKAEGSVCGCELEPRLDVKQSSISQSLSKLRRAGLLSRTKEGRWRYYETTELAEELLTLLASKTRASKIPA